MINETKKRPSSLLDHLPPARLSNAALVDPGHLAAMRKRLTELKVLGDQASVTHNVTESVTKSGNFRDYRDKHPIIGAPLTGDKPLTGKKRGRPPKSGGALSMADRARAYRARKAAK